MYFYRQISLMDCPKIEGEKEKEVNPIRKGSYPARKAGLIGHCRTMFVIRLFHS